MILLNDLHDMSFRARKSFLDLSVSPLSQRNEVLIRMADLLGSSADELFAANNEDIRQSELEGLSSPLLHRLKFGPDKLKQVCDGLHSLADLADPIGATTISTEITEGLNLYRVVCPIGVIGVIFESRPDTNQALCRIVRKALQDSGLPADCAQLLESREDVASMLKEDELIDLIIPRGSNAFVRYIMDNSRIPVLGHADGICHVYIDRDADPEKAVRITVDSKTQYVSVCNAAETLLIHEDAAPALLPEIAKALKAKNVEIRGDEAASKIIDCIPASEKDWSTEYLDYIISVRVVHSLREAVDHINHFGSHHTDSIVTENRDTAAEFMNRVDSAGVYWNVSTRFADGFVYGFGAEVGIATGKIHARGPMGLEGLTTYKYKLIGNGNILAEMKDGTRTYTHQPLGENCPL